MCEGGGGGGGGGGVKGHKKRFFEQSNDSFFCSCVACDAALPMQDPLSRSRLCLENSQPASSLLSSQVGPHLPKGGWRAISKAAGNQLSSHTKAAQHGMTQRPVTARGRYGSH